MLCLYFPEIKKIFFSLVNYLETAYLTGQKNRQTQILSGQIVILAGHGPVTGRYFEPCCVTDYFNTTLRQQVIVCSLDSKTQTVLPSRSYEASFKISLGSVQEPITRSLHTNCTLESTLSHIINILVFRPFQL